VLFHRPLLLLPLLVNSRPPIPARPAIAPWYRFSEDGGRLLFEHGGTVVTLEGRATRELVPRLIPLLDGSRAADDLRIALGEAVAPAVDNALRVLAENHLLVDGPAGPASEPTTAAASYAAAVTRAISPGDAERALAAAQVAVLGSSRHAEEIVGQLHRAGVGHVRGEVFSTDLPDHAFVLAAPGRKELEHLAQLNRTRLEKRAAWLQVLPYDGRIVVVGPLFLPDRSACRACYLLRRAACSGYEDDFGRIEASPTRADAPAPLVSIAAGLAALLAIRWLTARDPSQPGRFYALEAGVTLRLTCHRVLRVPRCAECGPPDRAVPSPWFEEAV
jgi:bacteriocin biosynthesis cyclodehydratase domain-containing protein